MNQELRDKMIIFNRKAAAAKADGYGIIEGGVYRPKADCPWEMEKVCDVDDYEAFRAGVLGQ